MHNSPSAVPCPLSFGGRKKKGTPTILQEFAFVTTPALELKETHYIKMNAQTILSVRGYDIDTHMSPFFFSNAEFSVLSLSIHPSHHS